MYPRHSSVWDLALDYGTKGTKRPQSLCASLCQPLLSMKDGLCHLCETNIPSTTTFCEHLCITHLNRRYNEHIVSIFEEGGESIMEMAVALSRATIHSYMLLF